MAGGSEYVFVNPRTGRPYTELMGHAEPKTTRRYTHGTERAKRAAVEAASGRASEPAAGARAELKAVAK